ncbi:MAG: hypothetical protein ACLTRK_00995 [Waltera sp.]
MNLLRKSKEQYKRVLFYTAVIWLLVSTPVFSKEFMMENDWRTAGILLVINAVTVGFTFFTFYGIYADSAVSALSTAVYVLSVYRFERYMLERDMAELIFMAVLPLLFYGIYGIEAGKGIRAVLLLGIGGLVTAVLDIGLLEIAVITVIMTAVMAFFLNRNKSTSADRNCSGCGLCGGRNPLAGQNAEYGELLPDPEKRTSAFRIAGGILEDKK